MNNYVSMELEYVKENTYPDAECQWCGDKGTFQFYAEIEDDHLSEMPCIEESCEAGLKARDEWDEKNGVQGE